MQDTYHRLGKRLEVGDRFFGLFQIEQIVEGGMGTVYVARNTSTDPNDPRNRLLAAYGQFQFCAIKTFQARFLTRADVVEQFVREAITWVKLPRHDNVVFAHYVNLIDGRPYLFLEYVEGSNLRSWIATPRLTPAKAAAFALQICEGMLHIHEVGKVVHRDLKPENILISLDDTLKVTDMGLVRALDALTGEGGRRQPGTVPYMAPEQFIGESSILSDIYSFGVVFFEMLTGERPSLNDSAMRHPSNQVSSKVPRQVFDIAARCLSRKPDERYSSFAAVREQLVPAVEKFFPEAIPRDKEPQDMYEILILLERRRRQYAPDASPSPYARYLIGHSLACLGQYDEALSYLEPLASEDDRSSEAGRAWIAAGHCLNALGRYDDARRAFTQSLEMLVWSDRQQSSYMGGEDPSWHQRGRSLPFVWAGMAYAWLRSGNKASALECLKEAAALGPSSGSWPTMFHPLIDLPEYEVSLEGDLKSDRELRLLWHRVKGNMLLAVGRAGEARRCFQTVLDEEPEHLDSLRYQAQALLASGQVPKALECYQRVTRSEQADLEDWVNQGGLHCLLKEFRTAIGCFDRALQMNRHDWRPWVERGKAFAFLNELGEASDSFDRAIELAPEVSDTWVARGNLSLGQGSYDDAVTYYERALGLDKDNAEATKHRELALRLREGTDAKALLVEADGLVRAGRADEAIEALDRILQLFPRDGGAWAAKAVMLSGLGLQAEALAAADEALRCDPANASVHKLRGNLLDAMGSYRAALEAFDRALEFDPDSSNVWNDKGYLLKRLEQSTEAMRCYSRAVELDPQNWVAWGNMGSLLGWLGRHEEALRCFEKVLLIKPDNLLARQNHELASKLLQKRGS